MTSGTDYAKLYNEAYVAYGQGNFEEAATLMEPMAQAFPEDPDVLLLRGHIYFSLGRYETACQQYQLVISRSDRPDLVDCANQGLTQAQKLLAQSGDNQISNGLSSSSNISSQTVDTEEQWSEPEMSSEDWESQEFDLDGLDWDSAIFDDEDLGEPTIGQQGSQGKPLENNHHREQKERNFLGYGG